MFFKAMLITAAIIYGWYLISLLFKFSIFKDNHKVNSKTSVESLIIFAFTAIAALGLTLYYVYSVNRQDEFLVYSGILLSLVLAVTGFVINSIYKIIVKKGNARYKEKYGEESDIYNPYTPVSILFDMAIILVGVMGYKADCREFLGICVSLIAGEYLGLYSLINKKAKEDTLLYKLKQVPTFIYILFAVSLATIWFEVKITLILGFVAGIFLGVILITIQEKQRQKKGKHSDLADYEEMMHNKYESKQDRDAQNE